MRGTVKITVTQPFTHTYEDGRKTWFGKGVHSVSIEVARQATAAGHAEFYRHQMYQDE